MLFENNYNLVTLITKQPLSKTPATFFIYMVPVFVWKISMTCAQKQHRTSIFPLLTDKIASVWMTLNGRKRLLRLLALVLITSMGTPISGHLRSGDGRSSEFHTTTTCTKIIIIITHSLLEIKMRKYVFSAQKVTDHDFCSKRYFSRREGVWWIGHPMVLQNWRTAVPVLQLKKTFNRSLDLSTC